MLSRPRGSLSSRRRGGESSEGTQAMQRTSMRKRPREQSTPSTEDLLRACLLGDNTAWRLFLERYGNLIYSCSVKMGVSRSDAEEVFQRSVLAILRKLETLRDPERIIPWITEIVRRQTLYFLRSRVREIPYGGNGPLESADPAPLAGEALQSLEASQLIREVLVEMDPRCRKLLQTLYMTDPVPAYKEIADNLGMPIGSVGPTRIRCLKRLRRALVARGYSDNEPERWEPRPRPAREKL